MKTTWIASQKLRLLASNVLREFVAISYNFPQTSSQKQHRSAAQARKRICSMRFLIFLFVQCMPAKEKAWVAKGLRKVMSHDDWSSSCIIRIERDHVLSSTQLYLILT